MQPTGTKCSNCERLLDEPILLPQGQARPKCPHCGSVRRTHLMEGADTVTAHASLNANKEPKRRGEYLVELFTGADWSTRLRRFMEKFRRIDREQDQYEEHGVDPKTGKTVHYDKGRLSDH